MKTIAIHQNKKMFDHSTSWVSPWISYCESNKLPFEIVDCYSTNIIDKLNDFGYLLWHFDNFCFTDMFVAPIILYTAKKYGLKIFPDFNEMWHFDDKIAEMYYLKSVNAPIPQSCFFYSLDEVKSWIDKIDTYPIVAKLRKGSGAHNVVLIKTSSQIISYSKKMFKKGISPKPNIFNKAKSNYSSSKNDWSLMKTRIKRIPEFYRTYKNASLFPNEKGYVFFQEFIPNDGYDLKIVVIGDKLGFCARHIRKNDFRASGSGDIFYDRSLVTKDIIESAFSAYEKLELQCMGFDYVVDKRSGKGKIVEMSYGFSHVAILNSKGYFNRKGEWFDELLNVPEEIINNMLELG